MCSVGDDNYEGDEASKYLPTIETLKLDTLCNKCRTNQPCIILRHKDAYCKDCFLAATTHKFKAFLGKHRLIYPNDKVLVSFKEGHECAALLHFIRSGLDLTTPKKLRFEPMILYIENNNHLNSETRRNLLKSIDEQAKHFKFDIYYVSLAKFIENEDKFLEDLTQNYEEVILINKDQSNVSEKLKDLNNKTQKLEVIKLLERNLLYKVSKHLGCKHVFTPELGSHVAAVLLTSVCLGRGKHLPLDIVIYDNRDPEVNIIRPLRHFETKEVAMYNYFNNIIPVNLPKAPNTDSSIQNLLRSFVDNLQTNFPATITTIVRTGDKLAMDDEITNNPSCKLCKAPIENASTELTSAESTMFSSLISNKQSDECLPPEEAYAKTIEMFSAQQSRDYCYACLRLQYTS
ncbi:cytoplasmic tRNA 2-thiolation protein 2-B isoform X1 [Atheta coriaria]|uniref:cytoplasmic tRNA 2-thiolation protein 2-B isoform X1 n=1 Tax=Dalotia coriaria TaxID=877792 RepID=UPI0031F42119